jgi:four helix bundle protein
MEANKTDHFNDQMRERTMKMADGIYTLFRGKKISVLLRPVIIQIIKSSSSVAANYRAAARGRSDAEYYAKICIVVEECDETQFWLDFLILINELGSQECDAIYKETVELVKIFTSIKKKVNDRLNGKVVKR